MLRISCVAAFGVAFCAFIAGCGGGGSVLPANPGRSPIPDIKLYNVPTKGGFDAGIVSGSDGDIWFIESVAHQIARVDTASGHITEFPVGGCALGMEYGAVGSDGNIWAGAVCTSPPPGYTEFVKTDTSGLSQFLQLPTNSDVPYYDTLGPDGNIWFTLFSAGMVGKVTPSGVVTEYPLSTSAFPTHRPNGIAVGPDGNLWIVESQVPVIDVVRTDGTIEAEYSNPDLGYGIAAGPDGNLWFTTVSDKVGKITVNGAITLLKLINSCNPGIIVPQNITRGPDDALWIAEPYENAIVRVDTSFNTKTFCMPPTPSGPYDVVAGSDGNIWFTIPGLDQIGEIVLHRSSRSLRDLSPTCSACASVDENKRDQR